MTGAGAQRAPRKRTNWPAAWGGIVLGAGLALVLPAWLCNHALLLVVGVAVHRLGMSLKNRLERRDGPPLWWEQMLFWLCWACLAGLVVWIAAAAIVVQQ